MACALKPLPMFVMSSNVEGKPKPDIEVSTVWFLIMFALKLTVKLLISLVLKIT